MEYVSDDELSENENESESESEEEEEEEEKEEKNRKFFCYLTVNFKPRQKINTHVGKSRNPYSKVITMNKKHSKKSENTPKWKLEMIIGPFDDKNEAQKFKTDWKAKSRGIKPRRNKGIALAAMHNKTCWDSRIDEGNVSREL